MATATSQSAGRANITTGSLTGANAAVDVELGFTPRHIRLINVTDAITYEYIEGMAATTTMKTVTAGTFTADTNSILVVDGNGFTIAAAAAITAKKLVWVASA